MQAGSCKKARLPICANDQPTFSYPNSSTRNVASRVYESKQESGKTGRIRIKKSKQFQRLLVSWVPNLLLFFSCVPAFLIDSSSAADVVIGSKKFTESYVL